MAIGTGAGLAMSAAGSLAGGLLSKKGSSQTQESRPYLPPEYEQGYQGLLADALKLSQIPRQEPLMMRVNAPKDWKDSAMAYAIQQASDAKNKQAMMNPQPQQQASQPQNGLLGMGQAAQMKNLENPGYYMKGGGSQAIGDIRTQFNQDPQGFMTANNITNSPEGLRLLKALLGYNTDQSF